ncbi:ABC transporter substrate-binding protein [Paracoccus aminophilus]|uniref:ABC transporter substrate-binding protein n=1 Tax=Paracoccus aminophilus JCM 7686 TaxID=1367847 RepID=S5YPJ8_PARAH|nr:ABC transporter substrate-binding protein [Paracoccus aminophilus]AGT07236.1 ABC transporter substrate-binding protein [Paracoccus aminophilus JCM 7686]
MPRHILISLSTTFGLIATGASANEAVKFGTNWVAQAEHGGYYQAVVDGTYAACGLDVTIVPGGPQVNNRAMMLAGKIDFNMAGNLLGTFSSAAENVPVVAVMGVFQKDPQVILAHPGKAKTFEDLKNLKLMISDEGFATFYQWMKKDFGFTDEQREVYTFNVAPFIQNEDSAIQGFISSEPLMIEKEAGFKPDVQLLADAGWSTYSTIIEAMADTVASKPEVVQCFVDGTAKGWYNYLYGDNSKAIEKIKADNPDLTDEQIAFSIKALKDNGIVDSGDTLEKGIGVMTETRIKDFYDKMVKAELVPADLDYSQAYTLQFVGKGVGLDLKK